MSDTEIKKARFYTRDIDATRKFRLHLKWWANHHSLFWDGRKKRRPCWDNKGKR